MKLCHVGQEIKLIWILNKLFKKDWFFCHLRKCRFRCFALEMSVITKVPEVNLWEQICKEFALLKAPPELNDESGSVATLYDDYDPAKHNPVFYGRMFAKVTADVDVTTDFDPTIGHPSCLGYTFSDKPPKTEKPSTPPPQDRFQCTPTEYLNSFVFPWLLPALGAMLQQAKLEKCFERKRTKFNACDFLTEYLYQHNPNKDTESRKDTKLLDIPFVKQWLQKYPRPPLPKSLIWSEDEAAIIIQSNWRGYLVRREPEIQELRIWQREWREESAGIKKRVSEFWDKQMPNGDGSFTSIYNPGFDLENSEIIVDPPYQD
ncbi:IQ domain-containing protein K-like isoform X2 [Physella acuta]|uniref:IQ domain-containing protein K-like isoform X2 n=1 Tax=Physella acuta TaxID=109671 RepID=UPI0027DB8377|nr:IQ domain-containing protein K-like isoform X2 [Physella acuta]